MSNKAAVEVVRRVWNTDEGSVCIEVGEWPDSPDYLELRTVSDKSIEWFGALNISMPPEFAKALGEALIAAAAEKGA
jgi:hypothetical protein